MHIKKAAGYAALGAAMSLLLIGCVAWAVTPCDSTSNPCFTDVADYLHGQRMLLPYSDLFYPQRENNGGQAGDGAPAGLSLDYSKDLTFSSSRFLFSPTGCRDFRGPTPARLFNTQSDWLVYLTGKPEDRDYCGSASGDSNILLAWREAKPRSASTPHSLPLKIYYVDYAQITIADVNNDGYDDVIISDSDQIHIYSAKDVNDPSAGLKLVELFHMHTSTPQQKHAPFSYGKVAIGDFNGDGAADILAPLVLYDQRGVKQWSMSGYSVCPAAGYVLYRNTNDPGYMYTCARAFEIHRRGDGSLKPDAFGPYISAGSDYVTAAPPKLAAGDFLGRNNGIPQLFADLALFHYGSTPNGTGSLLRSYQMWDFDSRLRPRLVSESRQPTSSKEERRAAINSTWPFGKYIDFVSAARLHGPGGDDADRDQIVLTLSEYPLQYHVVVLTYSHQGQITGIYKQRVALDTSLPTPPVAGLAVGRFDPPKSGNQTNFDQQITLLYKYQNRGKTRTLWSVGDQWQFVQRLSTDVESPYNPADSSYPNYDPIDGNLFAGDAQGRSLRLGTPLKMTIEDHLQPDLALGIPPMHIDYIRDASGKGPQVMNFTVYPSTTSKNAPAFNTQYAFTSGASTQHQDSNTTDAGDSVGGEQKAEFRFSAGSMKTNGAEASLGWTAAAKGSWQNSSETKNSHYTTLTTSLDATSGFADHIFFESSRLNVYYYPILGKRCPADRPTCGPEQEEQQFLQYSAPDTLESVDVDATTQEWYQPVQEPGNLFSYPWNLQELQRTNPKLNLLSNEKWKQTDTSQGALKTDWKVGGQTGESKGSVTKWSVDASVTVAGKVTLSSGLFKTGVSNSLRVDYGHSNSVSTMNTDTTMLDTSTGIQVNNPPFSDAVSSSYFYSYAAYIFGQNPFATSFTEPVVKQSNGQPVDQQFFGPLTIAFAADPFRSASVSPWWRQAYSKPDIGLNHPSRWTWNRETKTASFNHRIAPTEPPDLKATLNDVFYHMKGFFIGEASDDPDSSPQRSVATAGDVLRLRARIYNFSVADMPNGSKAHARFYGQVYDHEHASLEGRAFLIGEDTIGPIPGFKSSENHGTQPNWKFATTTFDTASYSGRFLVFWVVTWAEDEDGRLLTEQEGHGLTKDPSDLQFEQITDVPVEEYSNNVGMYDTYSPFFVAPRSAAAGSEKMGIPAGDARRLQETDVTVEATPIRRIPERSWVTVTVHNITGADFYAEPVTFYDGDPDHGGRVFDLQRIPYLKSGDTYALRTFFLPQDRGLHTIFVHVGAAPDSNLRKTLLDVP